MTKRSSLRLDPKQWEVRVPLTSDACGIRTCIALASPRGGGGSPPATSLEDIEEHIHLCKQQPHDYSSLVIVDLARDDETRIAAYVACKRRNHLSLLFVQPDYQGKGFGRYLVETNLVDHSSVTVNSSPVAIAFYQRLGFVVQGDTFRKETPFGSFQLTSMKWSAPV